MNFLALFQCFESKLYFLKSGIVPFVSTKAFATFFESLLVSHLKEFDSSIESTTAFE